jgi:hypothetical protein
MWQILSHDYDTHASFYGTKHASEPVHVQLNLPDYSVGVINNPARALENATLAFEAYALDGRRIGGGTTTVSVAGVDTSAPLDLGIRPLLARHGVMIVKLSLRDGAGAPISENVYWPSIQPEGQRALDQLAHVPVALHASRRKDGAGQRLDITLTNASAVPLLNAKLTLFTASGERVLPVYYSDNYVSLMPGESKTLSAGFEAGAGAQGPLKLSLRAWNSPETSVAVEER